uniref:Uncharacterized protein n=1 Tax=Anopheles coluzzii TaxID=1518534 RepID=A0A8W7NZK6_ANOCL
MGVLLAGGVGICSAALAARTICEVLFTSSGRTLLFHSGPATGRELVLVSTGTVATLLTGLSITGCSGYRFATSDRKVSGSDLRSAGLPIIGVGFGALVDGKDWRARTLSGSTSYSSSSSSSSSSSNGSYEDCLKLFAGLGGSSSSAMPYSACFTSSGRCGFCWMSVRSRSGFFSLNETFRMLTVRLQPFLSGAAAAAAVAGPPSSMPSSRSSPLASSMRGGGPSIVVGSSGCGPKSVPSIHASYRSGWNRFTKVSISIFTISELQ